VNIQSEPVMIVKMPDLSPRRLWAGVELGLYLVFRMSDVVSRPGGTGELGLFGFVFLGGAGVVCSHNSLRQQCLRWSCRLGNWLCFA
jgi:hypothetical protein